MNQNQAASSSPPRPTQSPALRPWILWAVAALAACLGRGGSWVIFLEAAVYLALLALVARHPMFVGTLAGLGRCRRFFVVALVALVLAGQLYGRSAATYPFASWEMYTRRVAREQHCYEYSGVRADGSEVPLRFNRELKVVGRQMPFRLTLRGHRMIHTTNAPARTQLTNEFQRAVIALGRKYNADHPEAPIVTARAWRLEFTLEEYRRTGATRRVLFLETPLAAERGAHAP